MRGTAATLTLIAGVALIAVIVASALPSGGGAFSTRSLAPASTNTGAAAPPRISRVFDSTIPAKRYGSLIAHLENGGTNLQGQLVSDLSPIAPAAFAAPIAAYRAYAVRWSNATETAIAKLRRTLARGSRAAARSAWLAAWVSYVHLGAVYGLIGPLDHRIDGLPGELGETSFGGLHRIELGLWCGAPPASLQPLAASLARAVDTLPHAVATAQISPLDYATRGHEILEDAQRDFLSGLDVPWSGAGVAGTAAAVAATDEVIDTLAPLMSGRDNTLIEVDNELALMRATLARIRGEHGGSWPALSQLTIAQREALNAATAGALVQLQEVPGTLETAQLAQPPSLP
jgi:iron uptake system EfeUOB component EfeO/EfeM